MGLSNNLGKLSNMITSTGSAVGIAQASPAYTLDVSGTGRFTGALTVGGTVTAVGLSKFWDGTQGFNIGAATFGTGYGALYSTGVTPSSTNFSFTSNGLSSYVNATNDAGITINNGSKGIFLISSGNVGIGTSSPSSILHAYRNVASDINFTIENGSTAGYTAQIKLVSAVDSGAGYHGIGSYTSGGNTHWLIGGGATTNTMVFYTNNNTERMRITSGGDVGIGTAGSTGNRLFVKGSSITSGNTTFITQNSAGTTIFYVRDDGWLISPTTYNNTSGVSANVGIDSAGNIFRATSSIKYKKDIKPYDKGLDTILLMNPIYYKSISDFDGNKQFAGFISEEIHELGLNEFVQYNDENNEPEGLNYGNITAILVKAIQEMNTKLDAQNQTIQNLQEQNQDLKSRLDKAGL